MLMLAKSLLSVAALVSIACSDGDPPAPARCAAHAQRVTGAIEMGDLGGGTGGDALIVPRGLEVTPRPGINSVFNVIALTLQLGPDGAELYAAVKNDGQVVACNPSFSVELRDKDDQTVGAGVSGLMSRRFYEFLTDGVPTLAGCVAPGEVTMVAVVRLSLDTPIEQVRSAVYQSNYWANLELTAVDGVSLASVKATAGGTGVSYTGVLVNELDTELTNPTVAVFPLNAAGRPLGVAYGGGSVVLPRCGTWDFETSAISPAGAAFDAYPMGGP
jgi:hypothetical protein